MRRSRVRLVPSRKNTMIERRSCQVCGHATLDTVQQQRAGDDRVLAEVASFPEHQEFTGGRIDVPNAEGEWFTSSPRSGRRPQEFRLSVAHS
jgi:hypothetical protein